MLAVHLFNINFIILSTGYLLRRYEQQVLLIYSVTNWSHSAAMDSIQISGRHCPEFCMQNAPDSKVQWVQVCQIWRPMFRTRIPPTATELSWQGGAELNPLKDIFSITICPLGSVEHMLFQKLLVNVVVDLSAGRNWRWVA